MSNRGMRAGLAALALSVAIAGGGLAGCAAGAASSGGSASSSGPASSAAESEQPDYAAIGAQSDGSASFTLTDKTGKDIVGISAKAADAPEYAVSVLAEGEVVANGETVLFYFPADAGSLADVLVRLADGAEYELHQLPVDELSDVALRLGEGVAYVQYTSLKDGSDVSTLEAEAAIAQAAAEAAAAAAAEAEAAAAAQAEAEAAPAQEYVDYGYQDNASYVDDSAVGGGDEEACIPDIVLNY